MAAEISKAVPAFQLEIQHLSFPIPVVHSQNQQTSTLVFTICQSVKFTAARASLEEK